MAHDLSIGLDLVTGAFSYTGRFVAPRLLARGRQVRTLTNHPDPTSPLGGQIEAFPFDFADPGALNAALRGVDTLYNTYWVRSTHGLASFAQAGRNTQTLIEAAQAAGPDAAGGDGTAHFADPPTPRPRARRDAAGRVDGPRPGADRRRDPRPDGRAVGFEATTHLPDPAQPMGQGEPGGAGPAIRFGARPALSPRVRWRDPPGERLNEAVARLPQWEGSRRQEWQIRRRRLRTSRYGSIARA